MYYRHERTVPPLYGHLACGGPSIYEDRIIMSTVSVVPLYELVLGENVLACLGCEG